MAKKGTKQPGREGMERINASLDRMIDEHGWAVLSVFADPGTSTPTFAYTVGLTRKGKPELIVMGMQPEHARVVLNAVARRLLTDDIKPHERLTRVLSEGYEPVLTETDPSRARDFVRAAIQRYGDSVRALQLVLPDAGNRLPWDAEFDPKMKDVQLLLAP